MRGNPKRSTMEKELEQKAAPPSDEVKAEVAAMVERDRMWYEEQKARQLAAEVADQMNQFVGCVKWAVTDPLEALHFMKQQLDDEAEREQQAKEAEWIDEWLKDTGAVYMQDWREAAAAEHADWLDNNRTMEDARY